jgi:hypothetical protein
MLASSLREGCRRTGDRGGVEIGAVIRSEVVQRSYHAESKADKQKTVLVLCTQSTNVRKNCRDPCFLSFFVPNKALLRHENGKYILRRITGE